MHSVEEIRVYWESMHERGLQPEDCLNFFDHIHSLFEEVERLQESEEKYRQWWGHACRSMKYYRDIVERMREVLDNA